MHSKAFLSRKQISHLKLLIHDDASTDSTADIIREYEAKYPRLIRTIFQEENQRSKGVRFMNPNFLFPIAKGEFIALCEEDDYWTSKDKIQLQHNIKIENRGVMNRQYFSALY